MSGNQPANDSVKQYLLGNVTEDERQAMEEVLFQDSDLFERAVELDEDLLERYLDGRLPSADAAAFEASMDRMPRRRERLLLLRDLADQAGRNRSVVMPFGPQRPLDRRGWSPRVTRLWAWGAAAAMVALAIAAGTLARQVATLKGDLQSASDRQAAFERERTSLEGALTREQERSDRLARAQQDASRGPTTSGGAPQAPAVVALTLVPGLFRDAALPTVEVSPQTLLVRLDLLVPAPLFSRYRAVLQTSAEVERWRQADLSPSRTGGRAAVPIELPRSVLTSGELVLVLSAEGAANTSSESYHFRVVIR